MPSPFVIPLINAGANVVENGINAGLNALNNRKQREYNEKMYVRQRQDSLNDWNMQNEYNSPKSQMQRLRDAKLNPNLVYGHGADATGGVPRGTDLQSWNPTAPNVNLQGAATSLMDIYDIKMKEAQIDNLEAQNIVIKQEGLLKATDVAKANIDLSPKQYGPGDMPFYQALKESQLEMSQQLLKKSQIESNVMLARNEREAIQSAQSLREGIERIATMRLGRELTASQKRSIDNDAELKRYEIDLRRKYNVSGSDPIYIRLVTLFLDKLGIK